MLTALFESGVNAVPLTFTVLITFASPLPAEIVIFPEPSNDSLLIVLIFVPETRVSCAPTSLAVYVGLFAAFAHADTSLAGKLDGLFFIYASELLLVTLQSA